MAFSFFLLRKQIFFIKSAKSACIILRTVVSKGILQNKSPVTEQLEQDKLPPFLTQCTNLRPCFL